MSVFLEKKGKNTASTSFNLDSASIIGNFQQYFQGLKDPRAKRRRVHPLMDIITIAILAVIAGAEGWEDIQEYGINKQEWLEQFLELPEGIPCPDTFRRVFERIKPKELEKCFQEWVRSLVERLGVEVVAIDGKTHRGSYDRVQQF